MSFNAKEFSSQFPCYPWLDVVEKAYKEGFETGKKDMAEKILAKISEEQMYIGITADYVRAIIEEVSE